MSKSAVSRTAELCNLGRWDEALAVITPAIAQDPDDWRLRCYMALAAHESGRLTLALESAEAAIAIQPEREWPHRLRGLALESMGRYHAAIQALQTAVSCAPDEVLCWRLLTRLERKLGNVQGAKAAARQAVAINPDDAGAWGLLGYALQDEWESALDAYSEALRLAPETAWTLNDMAWVYMKLERYDEANDLVQRAIRIAPGYINALFQYAIVTAFRESSAAAQPAWKSAHEYGLAVADGRIQRSPQEWQAYTQRSQHLRGLRQYEEAFKSAHAAVELAPTSSWAWHRYAWAATEVDDWAEAVMAIRNAHENDPENPAYLIENAEIAHFAGDQAAQQRWAGRSVAEAPDTTWAIQGEVHLALARGDYAKAAHGLHDAFRYDPLNCCHRSLHAYCLIRQGDHGGAERSLHIAERRSPCSCCFRRQALDALSANR